VYQRTDSRGLQWSLYRRGNGMWVFDYNEVENRWSGTVAYSQRDRSAAVRDAVWSRDITVTDVPAGARARTSEWLAAMGGPPLDMLAPDEPLHDEPEPLAKPDPMHLSELRDTPDADAPSAPPTDDDGSGDASVPDAVDEGAAAADEDVADVEAVAAHHLSADQETLLLVGGGSAVLITLGAAAAMLMLACRRRTKVEVKLSKPVCAVVEAKPAQVHAFATGVTSATGDVESGVQPVARAVEIPQAVSEELSRRSSMHDATSPRRLSAHL